MNGNIESCKICNYKYKVGDSVFKHLSEKHTLSTLEFILSYSLDKWTRQFLMDSSTNYEKE